MPLGDPSLKYLCPPRIPRKVERQKCCDFKERKNLFQSQTMAHSYRPGRVSSCLALIANPRLSMTQPFPVHQKSQLLSRMLDLPNTV